MLKALEKIFRSKKSKDVRDLAPLVAEINEIYEEYQTLSEEELKAKTVEFRALIEDRTRESNEELVELQERLKEDIDVDERDRIYEDIAGLEDAVTMIFRMFSMRSFLRLSQL